METFLLGWGLFLVASASPGPSTFAIMATSLAHGRGAGLRFASGVVTGSVFWGLMSATGVGLLLTAAAWTLVVMKTLGGAYLLWIAYKTARSATRGASRPPAPRGGFYAAGLGLHLTNPKAIFGWAATVAIGLPHDAQWPQVALFLGGCALMAVCVNGGYALAFSSRAMARVYERARRWIEGAFAAVFAAAGVGLLAWRP